MIQKNKFRIAASLSLGALVVTTWFALTFKAYAPGEIAIIQAIYALGDWLWLPMIVITQLGSPWIIFGLVIAMAMLQYYREGLRLLLATGTTYVVVSFMKVAIMRPRPFLELSDVISRELTISGNGFPSGHSAIAACIAVSLWFLVSRSYRPWLVIVVLMVGISRIYLGVHSPLDVVGGFSVGVITASIMQLSPSILKGVKSS